MGRSRPAEPDARGAEALIDGVAAEAGGRDIAALAAARDRFLIDLLALKKATDSEN